MYNKVIMVLTSAKEDRIYNALVIGMSLDDAYIYAGLTPQEIEYVSQDEKYQTRWHQLTKEFEFGLLTRIDEISKKQSKMGREGATTWMLEHMFPRYSGKPTGDMPDIHLHIDGTDPMDYDTVSVYKGE